MSSPGFWIVYRCPGILCVCFYFLFRNNVRKRYLGERNFHHCYGNFFESVILKVSFSTIARHINISILKDTLKLKILRTWIKIRANSFNKTWINIIKRKSTKVPWKLSIAKKYDPAFKRTLHQSRWWFTYCYMLLFLSNKPSF